MSELFLLVPTALWLGILTSISPCPLATNIAAMSYIGRRVDSPRMVLWTGTLYTLGRTLSYLLLGLVLVNSLLAVPAVSQWLQKYMNLLLGPILILVGMVLLGLISVNIRGTGAGEGLRKRVDAMGVWGAALLGMVFALSFCPTSAALFFGSLMPVAVKAESSVLLPAVYGIGTGLPVFAFAVVIALSANRVGQIFNRLTQFEKWARWITGVVFVVVGVYFTLAHVFGVG